MDKSKNQERENEANSDCYKVEYLTETPYLG